MHYCFFSVGSWEQNGSLLRLKELGSALIEQGIQVSYLLDEIPFNVSKLGLHPKAHRVFVPGPRSLKQAFKRRKLLQELAPDYIHVLSPSPAALIALAGRKRAKIVSDWDEWFALRALPPHRRLVQQGLDAWMRHNSDYVIAASLYIQEQFQARYGCKPTYIPHAAFMPEYADGTSPFSEPTAVYMGNLYPAYDHDILFEAAALLKKRGKVPKIEMIAAGPDLERWRAWVRENGLDNVSLPGYLRDEELWRHLRHAHVLLFPLRDIPRNLCRCPGKTFFYAQAKRPVITTRVGEVPQTLGDQATYVECTSAAFADAIEQAMSKPALTDVDYRLQGWDSRATALLQCVTGSRSVR